MKKLWLVVLPLLLLVFLLVPSIMCDGENKTTENTDEVKVDENTYLTEPDEPTIQTDGNETVDDEEHAGSGNYDEFYEKYTIITPPISSDERITVVVDGVNSFLDVLNATVIQTVDGELVIRHKNKLYILESDTVARQVATIWEAGDEAVEFHLLDGDYVFTLNMELADIIVKYGYINSKYCAGLRYYDLENVTSVRLEVSNFTGKEIRCIMTEAESETEIPSGELPKKLWGLYGYRG